MFEIHGTADDVTLWNGDPNNQDGWGSFGYLNHVFLGEPNDLEAQVSEMLDDIDPSDGSQVLFERLILSALTPRFGCMLLRVADMTGLVFGAIWTLTQY